MSGDWTGWLLGVTVILILLTAPKLLDMTIRQGYRLWPLATCWLTALMFGLIGTIASAQPQLLDQYFLVFAIFFSVLVNGMKFSILVHALDTSFKPWYNRLPKE